MSDLRVTPWIVNDIQNNEPSRQKNLPPYMPKSISKAATLPVVTSPITKSEKPRARVKESESISRGLNKPRTLGTQHPGTQPSFIGTHVHSKGNKPTLLDDEKDSTDKFVDVSDAMRSENSDDSVGEDPGGEPADAKAGQDGSHHPKPATGSDDTQHFQGVLQLPTTSDNGIFEVILPGGETMGVVVSSQPALVSFLMSPSSEKTSDRLRQQKMELEGQLERLIKTKVKITVL